MEKFRYLCCRCIALVVSFWYTILSYTLSVVDAVGDVLFLGQSTSQNRRGPRRTQRIAGPTCMTRTSSLLPPDCESPAGSGGDDSQATPGSMAERPTWRDLQDVNKQLQSCEAYTPTFVDEKQRVNLNELCDIPPPPSLDYTDVADVEDYLIPLRPGQNSDDHRYSSG